MRKKLTSYICLSYFYERVSHYSITHVYMSFSEIKAAEVSHKKMISNESAVNERKKAISRIKMKKSSALGSAGDVVVLAPPEKL